MEGVGKSEGPKQQDLETMIAFFDVETTVPFGSGRGRDGYSLLEFGAILVCPRRLIEVDNFSTLIRPSDLNAISSLSIRCNGITRDSVSTAPCFVDVANKVFSFLHGKVWAGHNILRFDCPRIREAFAEIGRPPPEPVGTIDTLPLLTERFGRRAGDMKMATLANYFCLGPQKHRSLDDVRLNLEVLKYCAAVLFLESSVSNGVSIKKLVSGGIISEKCNIQNDTPVGTNLKLCSLPVPLSSLEGSSCVKNVRKVNHDPGQSDKLENEDATYLISQVEQMKIDSSHLNLDDSVGATSAPCLAGNSADATSRLGIIKNSTSCAGFLEPEEVLLNRITVSDTTLSPTVRRIQILHLNVPLWLCCGGLVIHFGISTKFTDHAGRPKLSILVNAPPSLCHVLMICESLVQSSLRNYGSTSEWWPLMKKNAFTNSATIRLHLPSLTNWESAGMYSPEIYRIDASKNMNKVALNKFDAVELDSLLAPGTTIDAFFCLDAYDYQQNAGIRLVVRSLMVHSG
ncbi:protein NEN1-like [Phalaenopsis equestris]|uniref:protein NEN1-like n=1 Tax=Phalaenopsis equestris TaxID=78828 RepID=UPI0009E51A70|nr:protein NEN1-like [Phalaenopsis equestris]